MAEATQGILQERIDVYSPVTGAYQGSEQTWFGPDGRRLRRENTDAEGNPTLLFFVLHDVSGEESAAIYLEGGGSRVYRETFSYDETRRLRTTTYYTQSGDPSERTEVDLDDRGRERTKRYFRDDGTRYGNETVLWNGDGTRAGWDFQRVGSDQIISFRYRYLDHDGGASWTRRTRSRDDEIERIEVRTVTSASNPWPPLTPARFAPDVVSTDESETSPSFTANGQTMVFARYGEDWGRKTPFIARQLDSGWIVEPIPGIGSVYNLAIAADGQSILYAAGPAGPVYRIRADGTGWSQPDNLTARYGIEGAYPALTDRGDLLVYRADGESGDGIYIARREGSGFTGQQVLYVPDQGVTFDGVASDADDRLLVTRCLDVRCDPADGNGIWEVVFGDEDVPQTHQVSRLPYAWGAQRVPALGVMVFTDGDDILTVPLRALDLED